MNEDGGSMTGHSRRTRAERLREALADDILTGRLPPGARLDETVLAERFGVSRTPVREALKQLAATGLVALQPHKGAVAAAPGPERLIEMFEALAELESTCARLAAIKMSAPERRRLEAMHDMLQEPVMAGDCERYHGLNREFHALVHVGSHNGVLAEIADGLRLRLGPFSRAQFRNPGRLAQSHAEHHAVVTAILRGAGGDAGEAMRRHILTIRVALAECVGVPDRLGQAARSG